MEPIQLSVSTFGERELELTLREADVNRRIADLERREADVQRAQDALQAQRERLDAVREEYESRRDSLASRARELDRERNRLRDDRADLVAESLQVEQRERAVASAAVVTLVEPPLSAPPAPAVVEADDGWWAKQLGRPLEAASTLEAPTGR
jgi:peptidoglycan hydrolase CwlO-like protein